MQIVIVRHGETGYEAQKKTLGWLDKALNENGRVAAGQYATFLKQQDEHFDLIISSPLTRARQTAKIIADTLGMDFIENELIKERNFGELSGLTWEEFSQKYPELAKTNTPNFQENLPKGESIPEVTARVNRFIHFLSQLKVGGKYKRILLVTHTGIIRILLRNLRDYTNEESRELSIDNLSRFELEI